MAPPERLTSSVRWYRSFYFRIGFSFVVFVVTVLVAQSVIFRLVLTRPRFPGRSPNTLAAIIAADLGSMLTQEPSFDIETYLNREYSRLQPIYVVIKGRPIAANRAAPLQEDIRRSVQRVLTGAAFRDASPEPALGGPPFVMAPVQVANQLEGVVVLPPGPRASPVLVDVGRLLSVPGTAVLVIATVVAALFIFAPARRRLTALQEATQRLGSGDLTARAPDGGGDEISEVAATFNRMAGELAAREEALRAADRLRRQMLADVSHELKTPLTAMRGYVETLHMSDLTLDRATRERYFATLERETVRLDRIVRDLMDLARLEGGVGEFNIRTFAIARVFEHVLERHAQEIRARQMRVQTSVADDTDQVVADPDRIEQVVENLFANALRYTADGAAIELSAATVNDAVVLSVVDSGPGIPATHQPFVFDRFYKVDEARANGSAGSGLGLSIAKAIVDRHGGTISVTSEPGRTAFEIRLPAEARTEVAASAAVGIS